MPEGIYVYKIVEGGAAANSDLRERDIITKFDGETVRTGDELQKMLTYYKEARRSHLTVQSLENGSYVGRDRYLSHSVIKKTARNRRYRKTKCRTAANKRRRHSVM